MMLAFILLVIVSLRFVGLSSLMREDRVWHVYFFISGSEGTVSRFRAVGLSVFFFMTITRIDWERLNQRLATPQSLSEVAAELKLLFLSVR